MRIEVDLSALRKTRGHELAVRFLFGGLITMFAGIIAKKLGPGVGGLFLAFPAIFPAGATLIEKHEKEKKQRVGLEGTARGRQAAAIDAAGAAIGSLGLLVFAILVSTLLAPYGSWLVIAGSTVAWMAASFSIWQIRKRL